ncbi:FAD-binding oxidoreductase [Candidatus Dependentiae bacterium]|nr:FAD-binding oxidoreductase [Candidatus Dependentiae bacterium]
MSFKKKIFIVSSILAVYAVYRFIYFSLKPPSRYYCPVTIPGGRPLVLDDPSYKNHRFKTINDVSCLNETRVYDIIGITTPDDIRRALSLAQEKKIPISIAGARHSMGGQAFFTDSLVLDMTSYNRIVEINEKGKTITVESGATWHDIQLSLHSKGLAVKAMQSTDIFTVGGSLSVNAHGMDHSVGSMASTVISFTLMLADGTIRKVSSSDSELFNAAIGGYGLFGVILEVELEVTDNVMYRRDTFSVRTSEFPQLFKKIKDSHTYELFYAHLSTSPLSFFKTMIVYGYRRVEYSGSFPPLGRVSLINFRRYLINLSKSRYYGQIFKWVAEKYIDPFLEKRSIGLLSRNSVMHDSVEYLENILVNETDILQEYFIPRDQFIPFIEHVKVILQKSSLPVLNASIRVVNRESNLLTYAPQDMFALVLYLNQRATPGALKAMEKVTGQLIDITTKFGGTFFLPYQLHYTKAQLLAAYPSIDTFFALKRKYDPHLLFMNTFYAKYALGK